MLRYQIEGRGIHNPRLLAAMRRVPREWFIPPELRERAYEDAPLPIGQNQTISQPYMVAVMTELLSLEGSENVLEIGTGSGYQAAVLSALARSVHTIERFPDLAQRAGLLLNALGCRNVTVHTGDGSLGWPRNAPYQAILVTAAAPQIPQPLLEQLGEDGRLVIPVGSRQNQRLERWRKNGEHFSHNTFFPVSFVPLRGRYGWKEEI